jgi:hypothetical protein
MRMNMQSMSHRLTEATLLRQQQLMVFNWLPAAYAHDDWLGVWARLLAPREAASARLLRRASAALLERSGLAQRYLREAEHCAWAMRPLEQLRPVALELGVAMLGGWVRNAIEREQVQQQRAVLAPAQRAAALKAANSLHALPYPAADPQGRSCWPLARLDPRAVAELGFSGLAALLDDDSSGSRQRFVMRLPRGTVAPLAFDNAQKTEAAQLVASALSELPPSDALLTAEASAAGAAPDVPQ